MSQEHRSTDAFVGFRERKDEVGKTVRALSEVAKDLGAATLASRVGNDLARKLDEDRFNLVVVGEFNHGKSTLVNALLGSSVLPVGVTPTTANIHHIMYGVAPSAKLVFENGEEKALPFEEVSQYVVGGNGSGAAIAHLDLTLPAELLKQRIVLVDTPGVNDLSLQRADITYSYIPQADAVLFLLDAGQILKESERAFLQDKIIGQARDKILFVISKWDLLSEDEQAEALAYAKQQLSKLVAGEPVLFPVSAQRALAGEASSGVPELLEHLLQFLAEHRGRILLDNALGEALNVATTLQKGVDAKRRALAMDADELARRISAIESDLAGQGATVEQRRQRVREDISAVRTWARRDLDTFVEDAIRRLDAQLEAADPQDLKTYYQAYLEHLFRGWAEAETKEIGAALERITERTIAIVREDAQDAAKRMGDQLGGQLPNLHVEVDSFAFDLGVMTTLLLGVSGLLSGSMVLGGVMLVAAPVIGMLARERVNAEYKRICRERTPELIREVASRVGPKLDAMIDDFAQRLDGWIVSASEDLHRELLEVLESAKAARAGGVDKSAASLADTELAAAKLLTVRRELEAQRAALWGQVPAEEGKATGAESAETRKVDGMPPPVNSQGGAA